MEPVPQEEQILDDFPKGEVESILRAYSRLQIWEIWQNGKRGQALNDDDARLYEVMEHHMQYAWLWDQLDTASDEDVKHNGVDLVLHVRFHQIVENQLANNDPPAVRQVMRVLMQKGMKEHDAAHAIASLIATEIYNMMREQRVFDEQHYVRELRKLPLKLKPKPGRKK